MSLKIAIQADEVRHHKGWTQSYSARWLELAPHYGVEAVPVDVFAADAMAQIAACDAFMWRFLPSAFPRLYAKRVLHAVSHGLQLPTFPAYNMFWYAEDKVAQNYLLQAVGIPTPRTHVLWSREAAEVFCDSTDYPFVTKLATGYKAANVRLVRDRAAAQYYTDQMFGPGAVSLGYRPASPSRLLLRRLRLAKELVMARYPNAPDAEADLQHGYFYAQEFLPANEYDVRVIISGQRAVALRRFNRPGDFRASGSGVKDWSPEPIGEDVIRLAYRVARKLEVQTVALDVLWRGTEPVVVELSFTHPAWDDEDFQGYWILNGDPATGKLRWMDQYVRAEDMIFADFVAQVKRLQDYPKQAGA